MGPRLEGRGNRSWMIGREALDGASMGPRLEGRGNRWAMMPAVRFGWLQWGRVLKDAEIGGR